MPRDTRIADVLRAEGCTINEVDGWKTRGADAFAPVGVLVHHTAGPVRGDAPSLNVCINGRSDLPGPLCHVLLARSGVCHVIAAGRANHAGTGSWRGATGNSKFFGIEAENTGVGEPWPAVQLDVFVRATAALLRLTGNGAEWCAGHREYTPRKIDPAGIDLDDFRRKVAGRLGAAPPVKEGSYMYAAIVSALKVLYRYPSDEGAWDDGKRAAAEWWYGIAREHGEPNAISLMHADARKLGLLPAA